MVSAKHGGWRGRRGWCGWCGWWLSEVDEMVGPGGDKEVWSARVETEAGKDAEERMLE